MTTDSFERAGFPPSMLPDTRMVSPGAAASTACCRLQNGVACAPVPVSVGQVEAVTA